ncbi:DNA-processing protein DprA [Nocardioides sp. GY 10113]|uniref:DNA-processing protein DprA n=1 Tax=Nocardioides sp. GY 10113 TaxID=2569761 RepID=UPI0010A92410|nr:DNA-protecting protein DprA [Nocardioides sp. GY 10113]TIC88145.1 DNA-processing protein DprA [Nocardioides sp. GY 10113]
MSTTTSAGTSAGASADRLARVALNAAAEPGDMVFTGLVDELGAAELVRTLTENPDHSDLLSAVAGRLARVDPAGVLERADAAGYRFLTPEDDEWPAGLADLGAAGAVNERGGVPIGLWARGPRRLDELAAGLAVVGARSATSYGDRVAGDLAAVVGQAGFPVVSGAAYGIDHAAHRGALAAGAPTLAVLACGVDRCYPLAHRPLLEHLAAEHLVISEAPPGAAPHRVRFLARNRLIAALSRGTVVVEAAVRSGALNTLNWAQRMHRVTMGVPGPVTQATSEGVHHQIRTGGATLVTGGQDVLELIGAAGSHLLEEPRAEPAARDRLRVRQRQVLDAVPVARPATAGSIALVAGLAVTEVYRTLRHLQEHGFVEHTRGGWRLATNAP